MTLRWTREPPRVAGWYAWYDASQSLKLIRCAHVVPVGEYGYAFSNQSWPSEWTRRPVSVDWRWCCLDDAIPEPEESDE